MTGSKAAVLIGDVATAKVTESLLPLCVSRAKSDVDLKEKLVKLERTASYNRLELISSKDWAKMPGANGVNRPLAIACALKLIEKCEDWLDGAPCVTAQIIPLYRNGDRGW